MSRHRSTATVLLVGLLALGSLSASGNSAAATDGAVRATDGSAQARAARVGPAEGVLVTHSPRPGGPSMSSCGNMDGGT